MSFKVIFDGQLTPNQENVTVDIVSPKFLFIQVISPRLNENEGEGLIIGLSVNIRIPVIGTELIKYVPHTIFDSIVSQDADSNNIIYLPSEVTESKYPIYCGLNPSRDCSLRIYAEVMECGSCEILDGIRSLQVGQFLSSVQQSIIAANQAAQNTVLIAQSVVLGIVGAPLTGGASLSLPAGATATLGPTQALLTGSVFAPLLPALPSIPIPLLPG